MQRTVEPATDSSVTTPADPPGPRPQRDRPCRSSRRIDETEARPERTTLAALPAPVQARTFCDAVNAARGTWSGDPSAARCLRQVTTPTGRVLELVADNTPVRSGCQE